MKRRLLRILPWRLRLLVEEIVSEWRLRRHVAEMSAMLRKNGFVETSPGRWTEVR